MQGIARFGDLLFMTHSKEKNDRARILTVDAKKGKVLKQIRTMYKGLNHAGGVQSVADAFAIVPFEGKKTGKKSGENDGKKSGKKKGKKSGKIVAYDLRPVLKMKTARPKAIELNVDLFEKSAGSAGLTHLPDGKGGYTYILAVGAAKTFSIYQSNAVSFTDPSCKFTRLFQHKFKDQLFEAINLFTQADGQVFIIGMESTTVTIPKKIDGVPIPVVGGKEIAAKDDYMKIFKVDLANNKLVDLKKERHLTVRHTQGDGSLAATLGLPGVLGPLVKGIIAGIASHFRFGSSIQIQSNGKFELAVGQRNFDLDSSYYYNRFR